MEKLKELLLEQRTAALTVKQSKDVSKAVATAIEKQIEESGQHDSGELGEVCRALRKEQELLDSERKQSRLLIAKYKAQMEAAIEAGDHTSSAEALQCVREQKDRIKAITHERKLNIEELRSRLNADVLSIAGDA